MESSSASSPSTAFRNDGVSDEDAFFDSLDFGESLREGETKRDYAGQGGKETDFGNADYKTSNRRNTVEDAKLEDSPLPNSGYSKTSSAQVKLVMKERKSSSSSEALEKL